MESATELLHVKKWVDKGISRPNHHSHIWHCRYNEYVTLKRTFPERFRHLYQLHWTSFPGSASGEKTPISDWCEAQRHCCINFFILQRNPKRYSSVSVIMRGHLLIFHSYSDVTRETIKFARTYQHLRCPSSGNSRVCWLQTQSS